MAFVPRTRPTLPTTTALQTQRAVYGTQLAAFADMANHLGGWRFLRRPTKVFDYPSAPDGGVGGVGVAFKPSGSPVYLVRLHTSPDASALAVVFTYWASESGSSAQIIASLKAPLLAGGGAPTTYDAGCTISKTGGGLRTAIYAPEFAPPETASTGFVARPGLTTLTDLARPLNCPADTDVVVNLTCTSVRIHSATVWEMYQTVRP